MTSRKRESNFFLLLLSFSCNPSKKGVILKGLVEFRIFGVAVLSVILYPSKMRFFDAEIAGYCRLESTVLSSSETNKW